MEEKVDAGIQEKKATPPADTKPSSGIAGRKLKS